MNLTDDNFLLYAAQHYCNPRCLSTEEFLDDVARFKYLKRMIRKYTASGELQERVILNHIIVIHNVFGIEHGKKMCFHRIERELWPILKTFMIYLNYLKPDEYSEIPLDINVVNALRAL